MASYKQVTLKDPKTGDYLIPRVYGTLGYQIVNGEITPPFDPQLDAYTLQGHEASYFATANHTHSQYAASNHTHSASEITGLSSLSIVCGTYTGNAVSDEYFNGLKFQTIDVKKTIEAVLVVRSGYNFSSTDGNNVISALCRKGKPITASYGYAGGSTGTAIEISGTTFIVASNYYSSSPNSNISLNTNGGTYEYIAFCS